MDELLIRHPKCSYCREEAHWFARWKHGQPEFTVILDRDNLDDRTLYCDIHREKSAETYRPVP